MQEKEDLEYATELRKMEKECEKSRVQLQIRYGIFMAGVFVCFEWKCIDL